MSRLIERKRVEPAGNSLNYVRYLDDFPAYPFTEVWMDVAGRSDIYVVQTDAKVIERCLFMTTDPGDLVFDPTCGLEQPPMSLNSGGGDG